MIRCRGKWSRCVAPGDSDEQGQDRGRYDELPSEQLIALLEKRDRQKKLDLVWERDPAVRDGLVHRSTVGKSGKNLCDAVAAERIRRLDVSDDPTTPVSTRRSPDLRMHQLKGGHRLRPDIRRSLGCAGDVTRPTDHAARAAIWWEHVIDEVTLRLVERVDNALVAHRPILAPRLYPCLGSGGAMRVHARLFQSAYCSLPLGAWA